MKEIRYAFVSLLLMTVPFAAHAETVRKVRVNRPFLDLNNNQVYDAGDRFVNLAKLDSSVQPYVTVQRDKKHPTEFQYVRIHGPAGAGFVIPKGGSIRATQLEVVVDGDIILNDGINTHYLEGNRIQLYGNIMGTLRLTSQGGRIVLGEEVKLKPDMVSLVAYGDIVFESEAKVFQFAKGFAKPLLRTARDLYTDPQGNSLPLELGPQVIQSLAGNIVLKRYAEVDLNDRLDAIASTGSIILETGTYFRSRNKLLALARGGIAAASSSRIVSGEVTLAAVEEDLTDPAVLAGVIAGTIAPTPTAQILAGKVYGTRQGNQCKTGNGVVPECVQIPPIGHFLDVSRADLNVPLQPIDK